MKTLHPSLEAEVLPEDFEWTPERLKAQLSNQFGDEAVEADLWRLYERFLSRCEEVLPARNRITFMFPTYVVKLPWSWHGFPDNDWEGSVSNAEGEQSDWQVQYARTRLHYQGEIPVLFMERVQYLTQKQIIHRFGYEPEWVMSVDCGQVGVNRAGRLLAFDYGIH